MMCDSDPGTQIVKVVFYVSSGPVSVPVHVARVKPHNWQFNVDAVQEFEAGVFFFADSF